MAEKQRLRIDSSRKRPRETQYRPSEEGDVYRMSNDRANWLTDVTRGGLNFLGDASQYIRSALGEKDARGGFSTGDWMLGVPRRRVNRPDPSDYQPDERDRRASALQRGVRTNRGNAPFGQQEDTGLVDQFSRYLSEAENFVPGASDWGMVENSLRGRAGEYDAKLAAMYKALQGAIQADAPVIGGIYDEGISAVDESAQQATQAIMEGYDSARNAQTQQLSALGIGEAAGTLAADGGGLGFAAQDQGQATERVAETNQTNEDALTKNKAAALNFNTGMGEVAQLEGVESRGQLQNSLTDALTEMAFARSQEAKQRQATIFEVATQLQRDAQAGLEPDPEMLQALAEFNAEQQQLAFENALSGRKVNSNVMLKLLDQTGGDQEKASQIYAEWQAAGIV